MANEPKFKRLTEEQIKEIARLYMDSKKPMSFICDKVGVTASQVRSAVNSLKKFGVEFPERPRESKSRYQGIATELLGKTVNKTVKK